MKELSQTTLEAGMRIYNEKEKVVANIIHGERGNLVAFVQKENGNYEEVPVEQLSKTGWKVVTIDDFEQGTFFWYACLDDEARDNIGELDGEAYEAVFADALDVVQENHPEMDLVFDPSVQAGHGTIYLRDEAANTETSWDADDETEEFYERIYGMTSYKAFVRSIANWLEARVEELEYDIYSHTDDPTTEAITTLEALKGGFQKAYPNAEEELKVDTYRSLYEDDDVTPDVVDSWYGIEEGSDLAGTIDFIVSYGEEGALAVIIFSDGHLAHYGCQNDNDDATIDQCIEAFSMDVPDEDDEDEDEDDDD